MCSSELDQTVVVPVEGFSEKEEVDAKDHWRSIQFDYYVNEQPWSKFIGARVLQFGPERVFEFGCNAGKNIEAILRVDDGVACCGIDINSDAIEHARSKGFLVAEADEYVLRLMPASSFDVCFTVSVLDHLPNPGPVLSELARLSGKAVLLLEPWLGSEGKVIRNYNVQKDEVVETTPYSYSWNYVELAKKWIPGFDCKVEQYPLSSNLGRYYNLYTFTRRGNS